jgi:hypothetical protein
MSGRSVVFTLWLLYAEERIAFSNEYDAGWNPDSRLDVPTMENCLSLLEFELSVLLLRVYRSSYSVCTRGYFPGVERPWHEFEHFHPTSVEVQVQHKFIHIITPTVHLRAWKGTICFTYLYSLVRIWSIRKPTGIVK